MSVIHSGQEPIRPNIHKIIENGGQHTISIFLNRVDDQVRTGKQALSYVHSTLNRFNGEIGDEKRNELIREVQSLVDNDPARSIAYFYNLDSGWSWAHKTQLPLTTESRLQEPVYLRPLLKIIPQSEDIGVFLLSASQARAFNWREGQLKELFFREYELVFDEWRRKQGRAPAMPQMNQQTVTQTDRFDQHKREQIRKNYEEFQKELLELHKDNDWRRLIFFSTAQESQELIKALNGKLNGASVTLVHQDLVNVPLPAVLAAASEEIQRYNDELKRTLLTEWREAIGEEKATDGLDETLQALFEKRTKVLMLPEDLELSGYRNTETGQLFSNIGGRNADTMAKEPHLADRMIAETLKLGAEVRLFSRGEMERLNFRDEVASLLRF